MTEENKLLDNIIAIAQSEQSADFVRNNVMFLIRYHIRDLLTMKANIESTSIGLYDKMARLDELSKKYGIDSKYLDL